MAGCHSDSRACCPVVPGTVDPDGVVSWFEPFGLVVPGAELFGLVFPGVVPFGVFEPGEVVAGGFVPGVELFGDAPGVDGLLRRIRFSMSFILH